MVNQLKSSDFHDKMTEVVINMITSKENELIKHINSLSQKKYRDMYSEYVVEGIKITKEALKYADVNTIILCEELLNDEKADKEITKMVNANKKDKIRMEYVSSSVFKFLADTKTPQGMLAVVKKPSTSDIFLNQKYLNKDKTFFALDNIQDPGNLGTIIRTLDSAGFKNILLSQDTVDVYNPKVIRSTMGAIFRLNIFIANEELEDTLNRLKDVGYNVAVTSLEAKEYFYEIDFNDKNIIVIGNEANGVSKAVCDIANKKYKIPMIGQTESLNAAVATSIIAYEKVRRLV